MRRKKSTTLGLAVAAAMGIAAAPANAALVTEWDFTANLFWVTEATVDPPSFTSIPTFTSGVGSQTTTNTLLSWGASGGDHTDTDEDPIDSRSALEIDPSSVSGSILTGGSENTVAISHYNNAIDASFATLESASLLTSLTLTPTNPAGSELPPLQLAFNTVFTETPNDSTGCGFPSSSVCDDIFVVEFQALQDTFTLDDITYRTSVVAGGLGLLDNQTCAAADADPGCFGLTTLENEVSDVQFGFSIDAVEVPNPAMLTLFGTGLLALGAAARRRNKL